MAAVFLAVVSALVGTDVGPGAGKHLCIPGEQVLFACSTSKGKLVSLCASADLSKTAGWIEYRFGTPKKAELTFPTHRDGSRTAFTWGHEVYVNSEAFIVYFENGGYTYQVFDNDTLGSGHQNGSGVAIEKDGKQVSIVSCQGPERTLDIQRLGCGILQIHADSRPCPDCECPAAK
jgi:hypothetical protein